MEFSRYLSVSLCIAVAMIAAGCATLTAAGGRVRLVKDERLTTACAPLGDVSAHPPYGLPDDWEKQLRNATGSLGGDTVLAETPGIGAVRGQAYRCKAAALPASAGPMGCAKDTDCKSDRICDAGTCKAP